MAMLPELPSSFHEAQIDALQLGPRRELTLTVTDLDVDPDNRTRFLAVNWQIRFGGIDNFEEVRAFCSHALLGQRIGYVDYAADEISRVHRLVFVLHMYDDDTSVHIRCRNLTTRQVPPPGPAD
jgi:hypothetical protein